ncbi:MAG: DNA polymerase III subunit epsilon [Pseudomonadota bacterium]
MRQIVLDTETTGLEAPQGHRIIEIGCVELINRRVTGRDFHHYIKPNREIDEGAVEVHGLSNEFLADKPLFDEIVSEFLDFIQNDELVIHNAPFDVGFLNSELQRLDSPQLKSVDERCNVLDTLNLARRLHPGQKNNLDALCKRYDIDNSARELHGALLDARILADVYLAMTGGQTSLSLVGEQDSVGKGGSSIRRMPAGRPRLKIIRATSGELAAHDTWLQDIDKSSGGNCIWFKPS